MQSVKAYCKNNVSRFLYLHLHRIKYRCIFVGIVKPKIQFSFTFALTFHYICRISEAVRHSQAENVIFVCLCSHLLLSLFIKFHCMEGLVTKNTGSWYIVRTENGDSIRCKIKGNFRLKGIRSTNPVSVGDLVDIELNPDQTAFITRIHERKNYIIRRSSCRPV